MYKRRRYLIHPSSQLKYIAMSILPALLMSLVCYQLMTKSGEDIILKAKENISKKIRYRQSSNANYLKELMDKNYSKEAIGTIAELLEEIVTLENSLEMQYFGIVKQWAEIKMVILVILSVIVILAGIIALFFSHRIAGPFYRLKRCITMLTEGKDMPPVQFRKYDEFKEVADSLEKLRLKLKEKGVIS